MSKPLAGNIQTAGRRILHKTGGLGYWAARDAFQKIGKPVTDRPPRTAQHHEHKHDVELIEVKTDAFDMQINKQSVGLTPFKGEAMDFYNRQIANPKHSVSVIQISSGLRYPLLHTVGKQFRMDKVAHFRV